MSSTIRVSGVSGTVDQGHIDSQQGWRSILDDAKELAGFAWALSPRRVALQVALLAFTGLVGGVSLLLLIPIVNSIADPAGQFTLPGLGAVNFGNPPLVSCAVSSGDKL